MHNIETSRPLVIGPPAGQGRAFSPTLRAVGVDGSVEVVYECMQEPLRSGMDYGAMEARERCAFEQSSMRSGRRLHHRPARSLSKAFWPPLWSVARPR